MPSVIPETARCTSAVILIHSFCREVLTEKVDSLVTGFPLYASVPIIRDMVNYRQDLLGNHVGSLTSPIFM